MYDDAVVGRGSVFRGLDVCVANAAAAVVDEEGAVTLLYGVRGRGGCREKGCVCVKGGPALGNVGFVRRSKSMS